MKRAILILLLLLLAAGCSAETVQPTPTPEPMDILTPTPTATPTPTPTATPTPTPISEVLLELEVTYEKVTEVTEEVICINTETGKGIELDLNQEEYRNRFIWTGQDYTSMEWILKSFTGKIIIC